MPHAPLVIVANTLPVRLARDDAGVERWAVSPGGLVSALAPVARAEGGAWIGWTGEADRTRDTFEHDGIRLVPVTVTAREVAGSYEGACNRMLWPLYHQAVQAPEYDRDWWGHYLAVNERFATRTAEVAARGAAVWIHDYHLQLVPAMLRRRRPDVRIGFFLHIPFPPEELFARLPWRREVLEGMLGADVIGFQTLRDARNFARVADRRTASRVAGRQARIDGRTARVDAYPISIDTRRYEALARQPAGARQAAAIQERLGRGRRMLLGVDRLDYTKGIDLRLEAFLQFLEDHPEARRNTVFVQVAVPSRERIAEYQALRRRVEALVGQINGQYAEVGSAIVHYLRRELPIEELVAMYLAADVMVVTPLCDGMNLVAKEYVATRLDNTGALLLSEFAGSAAELRTALHVNPHDVDGVAAGIAAALELPPEERARRMQAMRRVVRRNTVHRWAAGFLEDLRRAGD